MKRHRNAYQTPSKCVQVRALSLGSRSVPHPQPREHSGCAACRYDHAWCVPVTHLRPRSTTRASPPPHCALPVALHALCVCHQGPIVRQPLGLTYDLSTYTYPQPPPPPPCCSSHSAVCPPPPHLWCPCLVVVEVEVYYVAHLLATAVHHPVMAVKRQLTSEPAADTSERTGPHRHMRHTMSSSTNRVSQRKNEALPHTH
jgi:hypothetical protein